ncbi:MAG: riboflavin biosynthesis protein RibF [Hyphomicrobium sp.]|nr:riboflavin biosynthesis protein RibF [Hyphomicrobium sp.]
MTKYTSNDIVIRAGDHLESLPDNVRSAHVVVGNFDGVHIGHRALLQRASELSARDGSPVVALTFEKSADCVAGTAEPKLNYRLTDRQEKVRLLLECGVDAVVTQILDARSATVAPASFVETTLARDFAARSLIVGQNFRLGTDGRPTSNDFVETGPKVGISVHVVPPPVARRGNEYVTSSAVHALIEAGDITTANAFLGRRWALDGIVVHGDKRGRELGFPTANLALNIDVGLKFGVYAVRLLLNRRILEGVACYGKRPQFDDGAPRLEVHLLDFCDDIYGQQVCIEFVAFQRTEMMFCSVNALVQQMTADCDDSRRLLRCEDTSAIVSTLDRRRASPMLH